MENPSGTTEAVEVVPLENRMWKAVTEPVAEGPEENGETDTTEAADEESEAESTEEIDSESETDEVESEESGAEADIDEMFELETGEMVSLKELLDTHKGRKAQQADYTKKTQAAAEETKRATALKAEAETLRASIEPRLQVLNEIESGLTDLIMGEFSQVNWNELRDTDPSQYLALKEAEGARKEAINQLKARRDQLIAEQSREEAVKLHDLLGWSDPEKQAADVKLINEGVKAAGVSDYAFSRATDAALMSLIYDGIKHRQLQEKKPEIVRKVKSAPKVASKPNQQAKPKQELSMADRMYRKKA